MCTRGLRAALAGATALLLATGLLAAWPGDELGRVVSALPAGNSSGAEAAAGPRIEPSSAPAGGNTTPGPACGEAAVLNDVLSLPAPVSSPARGYPAINLDRPVPWNRYAWPPPSHLDPFRGRPAHSPPRPSTQPSEAGEWRLVDRKPAWVEAAGPAATVPEKACLANATVVISGNSLARQLLYTWSAALSSGKQSLRTKQKAECKYACGFFAHGPFHVAFVQSLRFWLPNRTAFNNEGMQAPSVMLGGSFGLRPNVVIVGLGHQDAFEPGYQDRDVDRFCCFLVRLASEAGVRVFFRTAVPVKKHYVSGFFGNQTGIDRINEKMRGINRRVRGLLRGTAVAVLDEERIADAAFRQNMQDAVYDDHIHSSAIAAATLRQFLRVYCSPPAVGT